MRLLILALITILLCPSKVWGAQVITIPQGTTEFGPISVSAFNRFAEISFERASSFTDPNIKALVSLFASNDSKFFSAQPFCTFGFQGDPNPNVIISGASCPLPTGTTNIRATVVVTGGNISLTRIASIRAK